MPRAFAIGDIHGCYKTFRKMLLEKLAIGKSDSIYCIGDYIDRGSDSKGVIDFILQLRSEGYLIHTVRGNHEQMMLDASVNESKVPQWMRNGGFATLESFGITSLNEIEPKYLSFIKSTRFFIKTKDYIFVHAGLNFSNDDLFEDKEAMLWIRDLPPFQPTLKNRILIHGHTPQSLDYIFNQNGNCINIDGGCVFKQYGHLGKLVAINLTDRKFISINNCD